jgi:hypothetical protein
VPVHRNGVMHSRVSYNALSAGRQAASFEVTPPTVC